jgi:hypothetical protein
VRKTLGIVFLAATIPLWILYRQAFEALRKGPFGDELGSVAYPIPDRLEALRLSAVACFLIGVSVLVFDFLKWRRQRHHD